MASGNIIVQAQTEPQASLLLLHANQWMVFFAQNARLHIKHVQVVARAIPTSFEPNMEEAATAVYMANIGTIPSSGTITDL